MKKIIKSLVLTICPFYIIIALVKLKLSKAHHFTIINLHDIPPHLEKKAKRVFNFIAKHFNIVYLDEALSTESKSPMMVITFDDGFHNTSEFIKKYIPQFKCHFFVVSDFSISESQNVSNLESLNRIELFTKDKIFSSIDDLQNLAKNTKSKIECHSKTHVCLNTYDSNLLYTEIITSRFELENRMKDNLSYFAFPFGGIDNISAASLEFSLKNYKAVLLNIRGVNKKRSQSNRNLLWRQNVDLNDPLLLIFFYILGGLDLLYYFKRTNARSLIKRNINPYELSPRSNIKKASPLFTIIIAVYNGIDNLENTIQSILNQTYKNFELIIIDGGSEDGTVEILKKYNSNIDYWISEKDKGISDAFNKGVRLARGQYINFQGDGDGFTTSSALEDIASEIGSNRPSFISCRINRITAEGKIRYTTNYIKTFKKTSLLFKMSLPHQGLFSHIDYFKKYGLYDLDFKYSMDYEHLLRSYKNFPEITTLPLVTSNWREDGIGNNKTRDVLNEYNKIKIHNNVSNRIFLILIHFWTLLKYYVKEGQR